eukprot:COSAG03_NODE_1678_length_3655_cov_6.450787_4_plen_196_part_00
MAAAMGESTVGHSPMYMYEPDIPAQYPVRVVHRPNRGRCLVTTREVAAGSVVLAEEPLLTYLEDDAAPLTCAGCLRWKHRSDENGWRGCQGCGRSRWCSERCEAQDRSRTGGHSAARCAALAAIAETETERQRDRNRETETETETERQRVCDGDGEEAAASSAGSGVVSAMLSYAAAALDLRARDPTACLLHTIV